MQAKTGRVDEIGKNDPLGDLPSPGAAADKALGGLKGLGGNPLEGLGDKVATLLTRCILARSDWRSG